MGVNVSDAGTPSASWNVTGWNPVSTRDSVLNLLDMDLSGTGPRRLAFQCVERYKPKLIIMSTSSIGEKSALDKQLHARTVRELSVLQHSAGRGFIIVGYHGKKGDVHGYRDEVLGLGEVSFLPFTWESRSSTIKRPDASHGIYLTGYMDESGQDYWNPELTQSSITTNSQEIRDSLTTLSNAAFRQRNGNDTIVQARYHARM